MCFEAIKKVLIVTFCWFIQCCSSHMEQSLVLMVSFDGFRWDYLEKAHQAGKLTPNFDFLISNGVQAKQMGNVFITKTMPNHFTMVTGFFEESHGVIDNSMYDPVMDKYFEVEDSTQMHNPLWWNNGTVNGGGEPVWVTNQKQSTSLLPKRSGVMMWPGNTVRLHGEVPYYSVEFNNSISNRSRIDTVVNWFATEDNPINLGLLYFNEPDHTGHISGPNSPNMMNMIEELDGHLGYLLDSFRERHLLDDINIIVTSDHGMTEIVGYVDLDEQNISRSLYGTPFEDVSAVMQIIPNEGMLDDVYNALLNISHVHVYKKNDNIPVEYHYNYNRRISPILIVAEKGYVIGRNISDDQKKKVGTHGYNNSLPDMHPIFIASGPEFRSNAQIKEFYNIDIYELICHLLDIDPAPNNGSLHRAHGILKEEQFFAFGVTMITFLLAIGFATTVSGVMCLAACQVHRYIRRKRYINFNMDDVETTTHDLDSKKSLLMTSDEDEI